MTDIAFPSLIGAAQLDWRLDRNVAVFTNPISKTVQRVARGGDRWHATVTVPTIQGSDAARVSAWLDQVSRGDNWGLVPVFQNDTTGTESASANFSSLQGPWATAGLTGWSATNCIQNYVSDGMLVLFSGSTAPGYISKTFTVVVGAPYEIIVDTPPQSGNNRITAICGSTVLSGDAAAPVYGRRRIIVTPTTTAMTVFLYAGGDTDTFSRAVYGDLSITRAFTIETAAAAGSTELLVQGGLDGTDNFKAGQFVCISTTAGMELKRVMRTVRMIGGVTVNGININHFGRLSIEPALRGSVAASEAINHVSPWCRMQLANPSSQAVIGPPLRHGFSVELIEDVS